MHKLLPLLLLFSNSLFAQVPDYFANSPHWNVGKTCAVGSASCICTDTYVYETTGDTVFGPNTYKKIYLHGQSSCSWMAPPPAACGGITNYSIYNYAYLRQDSLKIWKYTPGAPSEELMYDFELNTGDTLPVTFINNCTDYVVDSIDSIMLGSEVRRRFYISNASSSGWATVLIEGLGSDRGFFEPMGVMLECGYNNICFLQNLNAYNWGVAPCNFNASIGENAFTPQVNVYPNPSTGKFTVEAEDIKDITVYNSLGSIIINQKNAVGNTAEIQLNNRGVFVVKIGFKNGSSGFERVVVE